MTDNNQTWEEEFDKQYKRSGLVPIPNIVAKEIDEYIQGIKAFIRQVEQQAYLSGYNKAVKDFDNPKAITSIQKGAK